MKMQSPEDVAGIWKKTCINGKILSFFSVSGKMERGRWQGGTVAITVCWKDAAS